jgi:hypothetical protein
MRRPANPLRLGRARQVVVAEAGLMTLLIVFTMVMRPWEGGRPGSSTEPTTAPGASGAVRPSPTASPDEGWGDLTLEPLAVAATLVPSAEDVAGVSPEATFALKSLTGEPALAMAGRLEVSPAVALDAAAGGDTESAVLRPKTDLAPGTVYRFTIRGASGGVDGSWAFRVRSPLRVLSTIPGDRSTDVPVRTGIEVTFDQDGAAGIQPTGRVGVLRAARPDPGLRPDGARGEDALHGHDQGRAAP